MADGYLRIKTKLDNSGVDKDISALEDKIKKIQVQNNEASKQETALQQEIDKYTELQQEADEYKNKIEELQKEKQQLSETNFINTEEYKLAKEQAKLIMDEYVGKLKELEQQYSKLGNLKNTKSNIKKYQENRNAIEDKYKPMIKVSVDKIDNFKPDLNPINTQIESMQQKYTQVTSEIDKQAPKIEKVYTKLDKVKAKQTENNAKIKQFQTEIDKINVDKAQGSLNSVGRSIQKQIGKVAKMAMAVFSIRTAWSAVSRAVNLVKQYNPQISADFEYMGYCIANALVPAIQWVTKLAYTLLSYINAIMTAWFGINLFANSSAEAFKKMKNNASGTAKSAKEIQKSLQGFDEMNILQDSSNDSGGSGSSASIPSMDLSKMQADIPKWLQWIIDNKDLILGTLTGIGVAIAGIKIVNFLSSLTTMGTKLSSLCNWITKVISKLTIVKGLGIGLIITGIVLLIKDLIAMISDPSWSNFGKILTDIGIIIAGISLLLGNWVILIVAVIAILGGLTIALFSEQGAILSVEKAQKNLAEATKATEEANNSYINSVDNAEKTLKALEEAEKKAGITGEELNRQVEQGILDYKDMTVEQKEVYKAYLNNEKAQKQLKEATDTLTEAKQKEKIASWENKLAIMAETGQYDDYKKAVVEAFENGELSAQDARDLIGKSMSEMSRDSQKTFMEDLPDDIKNGLDPKNYETKGQRLTKWFSETWTNIKTKVGEIGSKIGEAISSAIKTAINHIIKKVENTLNTPIKMINGALGIINQIPGVEIGHVPTVTLPRLAKGGVIAQPTTAIVGEAGKEAVVPLENNLEWLDILADKLASKIGNNGGAYIIQMNGKTVQRGIAKRQQEFAFATNGRS